MTYLQIDHVNAVMADRMREAEHARLVRQARQANKANKEHEAKTAAAFPPSPRPAQGLNAAEPAAIQQPSKGKERFDREPLGRGSRGNAGVHGW